MNVIVNDLLTHYELSGSGKLVVLLHGWGDSALGLAQLQADLASSYQVVAVDLPGFGKTQPPAAVWNLDNYAAFVRDFLQKIAAPNVFAVVGHSNGGAVAVRGVALDVLQPKKLVLIAAAGIRTGKPARRLVLKVIAKVGKVATFWLPRRYRQALRKQLYGVAGSDLLVVEQLQDTFRATVRQDVQADAARLTLPTLLLYAADDPAVPLADGQIYQRLIKNSRLKVVKDSGHFVHLDQPALVVEQIKDFLA